jgi:hypothetical protein
MSIIRSIILLGTILIGAAASQAMAGPHAPPNPVPGECRGNHVPNLCT